ncbi:MAG: alpha/beta fold hydrolase [Ruminococcaceae bacterium]|nr:alpha/beta fold hydrolase [Oscillospiraceae bacterium]
MSDIIINSVCANNNKIEYAVFGSGKRAFVIIPGLSLKSVLLSAEAVAGAYGMFAEDYTVYLFDRRNNMQNGVTIYDLACDAGEAMKTIGISDACVFGTSQGGMIAQVLAIKYPELVSKLVLGSTAARLTEKAQGVVSDWQHLAEQGRTEELCRSFVGKVYSRDFTEKFGEMLVSMLSDCTDKELSQFTASCKAFDGFDVTAKLCEISCPVYVIGADNDAVLEGEASREIADTLGCKIYMYGEPYGHAVYDEAPDYKEKLIEFFKS